MKAKISNLDHIADAGVEIFADNLPHLFSAAAGALLRISGINRPGKRTGTMKSFSLSEQEPEFLLVTFLNELNYYISVRHLLPAPIEVLSIEEKAGVYILNFRAGLVKLQAQTIDKLTEIKAVTYHKLEIKPVKDGYRTTIIFDL